MASWSTLLKILSGEKSKILNNEGGNRNSASSHQPIVDYFILTSSYFETKKTRTWKQSGCHYLRHCELISSNEELISHSLFMPVMFCFSPYLLLIQVNLIPCMILYRVQLFMRDSGARFSSRGASLISQQFGHSGRKC